jgi:hypothetical protein
VCDDDDDDNNNCGCGEHIAESKGNLPKLDVVSIS